MIFQRRKNLTINKIRGIEVVTELKYLGVIINNTSGCFRRHKEGKIKQVRRMANMTYSVVHRSCNKLMIGKTYWKSVVMPAVLMGSSVVCRTRAELETMQRIENGVWRAVLGAPGCAPVVTLRGEVGTSNMHTRDLKTKICYEKYLIENGNELLKETYLET